MLVHQLLCDCNSRNEYLLSKEHLCAVVFVHGGENEELSCRGRSQNVEIVNHSISDLGYYRYKVSSLLVQHGCELHAYSGINYTGSSRIFTFGIYTSLGKIGWNDRMASLKCKCGIIDAGLHGDVP